MEPSKGRPWIGICRGKGGEGDLDMSVEELSAVRY